MMFVIVILGLCLARCAAESSGFGAFSSGSTYAGGASNSGEWGTTAFGNSDGYKMPMSGEGSTGFAPKSRQLQFWPNTFYSQLNYQPPSGTVPTYRASTNYYKSAPVVYSAGGGYSGQGGISQVTQPGITYTKSVPAAYSIIPYSGRSMNLPQVAQPAFSPAQKDFTYPIVTADGYLKDTPEVAEAKQAHFAEKLRIGKLMGNDNGGNQFSYAAPQSQFSYQQAEMGGDKSTTGSMFTPNSFPGMTTASSEGFTSFGNIAGRQKRSIPTLTLSFHHPTFHALPAPLPHALLPPPAPLAHALPAPLLLPPPAPLALPHSLPIFHHGPSATFYSSAC